MALTKIDDRGLKTPIDLIDNEKIRFGTGNDSDIFHDGSNMYLTNTAGSIYIQGKAGENSLKATPDGNVELYHDNNKKLETTSAGVLVSGNYYANDNNLYIAGTANDMQMFHNGLNSYITNSTGWLVLGNGGSGTVIKSTTDENGVSCTANGAVELYYDNAKKVETTSTGITVSGNANIPDGSHLYLGASNDLDLYHAAGADSFLINSSGQMYQRYTNNLYIQLTGSNENAIVCSAGAQVELYYDNVKKFQTTSSGVTLVDGLILDNATNAGRDIQWQPAHDRLAFFDNTKATFGDGVDLQIFHDGSSSYIRDTGTGSLYLDTNKLKVNNAASDASMIIATETGSVELWYDNSKKLETTANGIFVKDSIKIEEESGSEYYTIKTNSYGGLEFQNETTKIAEFTDANTLELQDNLKFSVAGKGIDFSTNASASGMTSELLADYEHGTWDPRPTASNPSWLNYDGTYVRVGSLVHCDMWLRASGTSSATSQMVCSLPFAATDESNTTARPTSAAARVYQLRNWGSNGNAFAWVSAGSTNMNWMWDNDGANPGELSMNVWQSGAEIHASITYRTNV